LYSVLGDLENARSTSKFLKPLSGSMRSQHYARRPVLPLRCAPKETADTGCGRLCKSQKSAGLAMASLSLNRAERDEMQGGKQKDREVY